MELIAIVGGFVWAASLWVGGRLDGIRSLVPEKIWARVIGLMPQPKSSVRPPAAVVSHRGRRTKRGYYYVNTSR